MINVDDRILDKVDANEFWLLCHLAKRLNKERICWPSNSVLCKETGWAMDKLQKYKKQLVDKGLLKVVYRKNLDGGQGANAYLVKTNLIGIFVSLNSLGAIPENTDTPGISDTGTPTLEFEKPIPDNQVTEVLTNEVLNSTSSTKVDVTETVLITDAVDAPLVIESKSKKARARKKANKETDECYVDFVDAWCKQYPDLGFDDVSGNKIKSMIKRTKERLIASGKEPTREAAVAAFQYVLAYVKRESHWVHGKHIGAFDQHYNSVVREIKEGKQKKPANNPSSSIFGKYGHL